MDVLLEGREGQKGQKWLKTGSRRNRGCFRILRMNLETVERLLILERDSHRSYEVSFAQNGHLRRGLSENILHNASRTRSGITSTFTGILDS